MPNNAIFGTVYDGIVSAISNLILRILQFVYSQVGDMVEDKDAELAVFLSSLKLEEIPNPGDHISLPPEVIECAASLSAKENAVEKLTDAMKR